MYGEQLCIAVLVLSCCFGVIYCDLKQNYVLQSARCKTKCLAKHSNDIKVLKEKQRGKKTPIEQCHQLPKCFSCIKPCDADPTDIFVCSNLCSPSDIDCHVSCLFLAEANVHKPGKCPDFARSRNTDTKCTKTCRNDGHCPENKKCCSNNCEQTCLMPLYSFQDGLFPIPKDIRIAERRHGRSVRLNWRIPMGTNNASPKEHVIYIVQMRQTLNIVKGNPVWDKDTSWVGVRETHKRTVGISGIKAGWYYQFRVASVNEHGSLGFSEPSQSYKSSRDISRPSPPRNLTEGMTVLKNNKIDVTVHWKSPTRSDIPIWKYNVYWSERLTSITPVLIRIDVLEQSVPSHQNNITLVNLNMGSTYFVQVEAVARLRNKILKSRRSSLYIHTYTPPGYRQASPFDAVTSYNPDTIGVWNLSLQGQVYYRSKDQRAYIHWTVHQGDMKYVDRFMVYWSPTHCGRSYESQDLVANSATTHDTYFELYHLKFECDYIVKVMASNLEGQNGYAATLTFHTPKCSQVFVRGNNLPECPDGSVRPPKKPPDVHYLLTIKECNISVDVKWKPPKSDLPILHYTVTVYIIHEVVLNNTKSENITKVNTKLIRQNKNFIRLPNLKENEFYVIQVMAVSRAGDGRPGVIYIWTPKLLSSCFVSDTGCGAPVEPISCGYHLVGGSENNFKWDTLSSPAALYFNIPEWLMKMQINCLFSDRYSFVIFGNDKFESGLIYITTEFGDNTNVDTKIERKLKKAHSSTADHIKTTPVALNSAKTLSSYFLVRTSLIYFIYNILQRL